MTNVNKKMFFFIEGFPKANLFLLKTKYFIFLKLPAMACAAAAPHTARGPGRGSLLYMLSKERG